MTTPQPSAETKQSFVETPESAEDILIQIQQAKQEWETTVDSLPQLVCLLDSQQKVIRANKTIESWNLGQVIAVKGKNIHTLLHARCFDQNCYLQTFIKEAWLDLAKGEAIEIETEDQFLNRSLYLQLRPIVAQIKIDKRASFAALIIQDITARKYLEKALTKVNEELEQRVEERTIQLQNVALENARLYEAQREQYRRLQQSQEELIRIEKMAVLGRLVASIAHEINNPLQSVQGFLDLLQEETERQRRKEKLQYYLGIASNEIERISAIVRRMRDFYRSPQTQSARPQTLDEFYGMTQTDLRTIDLKETLESVFLLTTKKLQQCNIIVEYNWSDSLPKIEANPDHLKQVFLNLILNSIDAMSEQGGRLKISTDLIEDLSNNSISRPMAQIEFKDTGEGMEPEVLSRIFNPLFSTKEQGSGFGLYTSREIIEAHQGQIMATSQVNKGTTFTIRLPVKQ